ncbi:hypothetical protein [Aureimonas sp. SK2]|uniref:hypothetical protein n=1 Tax=Aureimonas sp. SK2 TaxID=3015992 RepID=UPI002444D48E|nr:hypothetical protein [Aureimonas sp. SK2]
MSDDAEAGGGLLVAVVKFAITSGAVVAGVPFDASGYQPTFAVSAALLGLAAILGVISARAARSGASPA